MRPVPDHRPKGDYILVTTGGGGDGADLVHNVIDAYREDLPDTQGTDHARTLHAGKAAAEAVTKGAKVPYIEIREFDNRMEELIAGAKAVVSMGGYNTYCEIMSFDKPALIVPRTVAARRTVDPRPSRLRTRPDRNDTAG